MLEKAAELSFPSSVVEYMQGLISQPPGGFPEPLRHHTSQAEVKIVEATIQPNSHLDFNTQNFDFKDIAIVGCFWKRGGTGKHSTNEAAIGDEFEIVEATVQPNSQPTIQENIQTTIEVAIEAEV